MSASLNCHANEQMWNVIRAADFEGDEDRIYCKREKLEKRRHKRHANRSVNILGRIRPRKKLKHKSENAHSKSSSYKYVTWHKKAGKWQATLLTKRGKAQHCGFHSNEEDAARALNAKCVELRIPVIHPQLEEPVVKKPKSEFIGVSWEKNKRKWRGRVCYKGKNVFVGYFVDDRNAAVAVNGKCRELGIPIKNPDLELSEFAKTVAEYPEAYLMHGEVSGRLFCDYSDSETPFEKVEIENIKTHIDLKREELGPRAWGAFDDYDEQATMERNFSHIVKQEPPMEPLCIPDVTLPIFTRQDSEDSSTSLPFFTRLARQDSEDSSSTMPFFTRQDSEDSSICLLDNTMPTSSFPVLHRQDSASSISSFPSESICSVGPNSTSPKRGLFEASKQRDHLGKKFDQEEFVEEKEEMDLPRRNTNSTDFYIDTSSTSDFPESFKEEPATRSKNSRMHDDFWIYTPPQNLPYLPSEKLRGSTKV